MQIAKERLYLDAEGTKLVREGDPEGATLYCAPGDEIPEDAAKLFGLVDGDLPDGKPAKAARAGKNKEAAAGENKGAGEPPADPPAPPPAPQA